MDIRSRLEFFLFRFLLGSLCCFPYPVTRQVFLGLAWLTGSVFRYRRRVVRKQLAAVYPRKDSSFLEETTNLVYHHLGLTAAEVFCRDTSELLDQVRVSPGWEGLDGALAKGRGVLIASGHLGNFELGGAMLARRYRLLDVVKTQRNLFFDRYLQSKRHRLGIETVPMPDSGRPILAHLRKGGMVSLLLDQDAGNQGTTTDFLGLPASTWPGIARISIRTGCPVVPLALLRTRDGGHELRIQQELEPSGLVDCPEDVARYLQKISSAVEELIEGAPEQWFWVHRRWKSRKNGGLF